VRLDEDLAMSYAYSTSSSNRAFKHEEWGVWTLKVSDEGIRRSGLDIRELLRSDIIEQHGLFMWFAWFVIGLLLLVTKRYAKKLWKFTHYLHAILGYTVLIITIIFALRVTQWAPFESLHNGLGSITVVVAIIGSLSGSIAAGTMRFYNGDKEWNKEERVQLVAKIHRYFGYLMLFIGNACIMTGVGHYYGDRLKNDERRVLGVFSFLVFCLLVVICEGIYRVRNKYSMGHIALPQAIKNQLGDNKLKTFTPNQIDNAVKEGKTLVIFDNLVLDVNGFERIHPGGKFNITHNYGRDISKFFLGGYKLVNANKNKPHRHSQAALDIVNSLVIGVIKSQESV